MKTLELKVPPLVLLLAGAMFMVVIDRWMPVTWWIPGGDVLASGLLLAGCGIALAGVAAFRRADTTVDPRVPHATTRMVTTGIYARTRNPMYVGFILVLAALAVYLANPAAAIILPFCAAYLHHFQIKPEERHLAARFGNDFVSYCQRTPRWF